MPSKKSVPGQPEGCKPQAAGVIHTDFERGFIGPRSTPSTPWKNTNRSRPKGAGKLRVEGKEYDVQDGDVMHFQFNV